MESSTENVVITGLGAVMPVGLNMKDSWNNLLAGKSGIGKITKFDDPTIPCQVAGEIRGFNPKNYVSSKEATRMDPHILYGIASTREAVADAGLNTKKLNSQRCGVYTGVGLFGADTVVEMLMGFRVYGYEGVKRHAMVNVVSSMLCGFLCRELAFKGFGMNIQTACASATTAIGMAYQLIKAGMYDCIVVTGSETPLIQECMAVWCQLNTASINYNDNPEKASRPFDENRDGLVMSEGASTVIVESESHARNRGAKIYSKIIGFGQSNDAYSLVAPFTQGQQEALRYALNDAKITPNDVGYINAHGTSTLLGDLVEAETIATVFGRDNQKVRIGCTKSMTGHTMGSIGAFETAVAALALKEKKLPPNLNIDEPVEKLGWIGNSMEVAPDIKYSINMNFGFGGCNAVLVLEAVD